MWTYFRGLRIRWKIMRLCKGMRMKMNEDDVQHCVGVIKEVLQQLPYSKKEDLLDICRKVLEDGC